MKVDFNKKFKDFKGQETNVVFCRRDARVCNQER